MHSFSLAVSSTCANSEKLRPSGLLRRRKAKNKSPWRRLAGASFFVQRDPECDTSEMAKNLILLRGEMNTFWFLLCKQTKKMY